MLKIFIAASLAGLAAAQTKSTIRAEKGNLVFASPDGAVSFEGANKFSIQSDSGEYDLNTRLSTIETESESQLETIRNELAALKAATEKEMTDKFAEAEKKIAANNAILENMKKACPLGSVVTQVGDDGTLQCTDYKVQQAITEGCPAGEAVVSVAEDGKPECAKVQAPVQACPAGSSIASVDAATGAVTCEKDGADREYASFHTVWGRQVCSGDGELVYSGAMAGGRNSENGGSSTYMCLPTTKPFATAGMTGSNNEGAGINIIEFRGAYDLQFGNNRWQYNVNSGNFDGDDASCAVCKTVAPAQLVITGRNTCPAGYKLDYRGWLAGSYWNHNKAAGNVCLHNTPQASIGQSEGLNNRGFLYLTELEPQGLAKNGLANGYRKYFEINCAQCSSTSTAPVDTYTRWGADSCPTGHKMLYDGFIGQGRYNRKGGGTTYECMARGPEYTFDEGRNNAGNNQIHAVDYWTSQAGSSGKFKKMNYRDAACAVCEVPTSKSFTLTGSMKCPDGYDVAYKGLIMATKSSDAHLGEHICVDEDPKMTIGGSASNGGGGRLHPVEIRDPPIAGGYKNFREVGCAQCVAKPEKYVTTYPVWGRRACPSGSKTLFSGWMGNGQSFHKGGGHNYQCMHQSGEVDSKEKNDANNAGNSGSIYRTEYFASTKTNAGTVQAKIKKLNYNDAACAMCEVEGSDTFMYPAKTACPAGYKKLYEGVVAGGHQYHQHETEYICLEKDFEALDSKVFAKSSNTNQNGNRLTIAEVDTAFYGVGYQLNRGIQCVMCLRE